MPFDTQGIYDSILQDPLFIELNIDEVELKGEIVRCSNRLNPNCYNYLTLIELMAKHNLTIKAIQKSIQAGTELSPLLLDATTQKEMSKYHVGDIEGWFFQSNVKLSDNPYLHKTTYGNLYSIEQKKCNRAFVGVVQNSSI